MQDACHTLESQKLADILRQNLLLLTQTLAFLRDLETKVHARLLATAVAHEKPAPPLIKSDSPQK